MLTQVHLLLVSWLHSLRSSIAVTLHLGVETLIQRLTICRAQAYSLADGAGVADRVLMNISALSPSADVFGLWLVKNYSELAGGWRWPDLASVS